MDVSILARTNRSDEGGQVCATRSRLWVRPFLSRLEAGSAENQAVQNSDLTANS